MPSKELITREENHKQQQEKTETKYKGTDGQKAA